MLVKKRAWKTILEGALKGLTPDQPPPHIKMIHNQGKWDSKENPYLPIILPLGHLFPEGANLVVLLFLSPVRDSALALSTTKVMEWGAKDLHY